MLSQGEDDFLSLAPSTAFNHTLALVQWSLNGTSAVRFRLPRPPLLPRGFASRGLPPPSGHHLEPGEETKRNCEILTAHIFGIFWMGNPPFVPLVPLRPVAGRAACFSASDRALIRTLVVCTALMSERTSSDGLTVMALLLSEMLMKGISTPTLGLPTQWISSLLSRFFCPTGDCESAGRPPA